MKPQIPRRIEKTNSRSRFKEQTKFPAFLRFIRNQPCVICGQQSEAAHLRMSSAKYNKSNGRDDKFVTPLCPGHHRLYPDAQHNMGERQFWESHGIDPLEISERLWAQWIKR